MLDSKLINDITKKLSAALPSSVKDFQTDMQQKFHDVLQGVFAKLDLVTREEFDTQTRVLARTRAKLTTLERKISELEAKRTTKTATKSTKGKKES